ncbi:MAG: 2-oxoacid:acceptor oxidoreductase family protein [Deltaproteobacteria bacterium]|nr:2-oxoacid:acceptor oxidoreductase family protein [Deltaproteobacteria bacterium]MBW2283413.1 2-oxoacid:acceptor oxidoreductase family protein [Deltaproteobacteria bacterium]
MTDQDRYEIRFGGSGGQGIILAAIVMAEAAGIYEGKHVCQTQSYGPEARGGASKAEVVISNEVIDYPKALRPNLFLSMSQASCDAYGADLTPDGLAVVDETLVRHRPHARVAAIPFTRIAREKCGTEVVANMVALGAVGHLCRLVKPKSLEKALLARAPKGTEEVNLKALRAGVRAAKKIDISALPAPAGEED